MRAVARTASVRFGPRLVAILVAVGLAGVAWWAGWLPRVGGTASPAGLPASPAGEYALVTRARDAVSRAGLAPHGGECLGFIIRRDVPGQPLLLDVLDKGGEACGGGAPRRLFGASVDRDGGTVRADARQAGRFEPLAP